jgi:hypothetical protein
MAMVSRNVPPWAAVSTIMPAVGGASSTTVHSPGEKAAFVVMSCSCVPRDAGHVKDLAVPADTPHPAVGESTSVTTGAYLASRLRRAGLGQYGHVEQRGRERRGPVLDIAPGGAG